VHDNVLQNPAPSISASVAAAAVVRRVVFMLCVFLGAFLLFVIEPLIGKIVTPKFGGISAVWSMCMLFFQGALVAGYFLTYLLSKLSPRVQAATYCALMLASLVAARVPPSAAWDPGTAEAPVRNLLLLLILHAALPCVLLSTISGMMQHWYSLSELGNPYPLYSVSNLGSLGALLLYPVIIERNLSVSQSLGFWNVAYILQVLLICATPWRLAPATHAPAADRSSLSLPARRYLLWLALSAAGSLLLLGFTNHLTHNIAPVPLLWVIPLAIYLLTFVLAFSERRFYRRSVYVPIAQLLLVMFLLPRVFGPVFEVLHALCMLYVLCMICHGELAAKKPPPANLPIYYLVIAIGGMIGGILVNLVAPFIFSTYAELPLALCAMGALTLMLGARHRIQLFGSKAAQMAFLLLLCLATAICGYGTFKSGGRESFGQLLYRGRNFYGTTEVRLNPATQIISVFNGAVVHGAQIQSTQGRRTPLTYYHHQTAVALVDQMIRQRRQGKPIRIGAVGLGAGTVAAYARAGDDVTFYELDPKMRQIAQREFTYLSDCPATQRIEMGDARLTLRSQTPQQFDLLIVDAFSGDSIPVHLLTEEAGRLYFKHLARDGVLLMHCTNRYLNLTEVVDQLGAALGVSAMNIQSTVRDDRQFIFSPKYVALCADQWFTDALAGNEWRARFDSLSLSQPAGKHSIHPWTDDFSDVLSSLYLTAPASAK
jgi:hypothetical protein